MLERGVVLEDEADAALLRRQAGHIPPASGRRRASGVSSPAMTRSSVDLPLPLGPSSAVSEPLAIASDTSVERDELTEALRHLATAIAIGGSPFGRGLNRFIDEQRQQGQDREHHRGGVGADEVERLVPLVDVQRKGLGTAGETAGDDRHRAELAERRARS